MAPQCDRYEQCREDQVNAARFEGTVLNELKNLRESVESGFKALWTEMSVNRTDIKQLYYKVGLIAGGTSLVVSLVVSVVVALVSK